MFFLQVVGCIVILREADKKQKKKKTFSNGESCELLKKKKFSLESQQELR